jgi:hypothetical protein
MPVNVRFTRTELEELEKIAAEKNVSRGEVIRRLVRVGLPSARLTIPARDLAGTVRAA